MFHVSAVKLTKAHKDMQLYGKSILESIMEALLGRQLPQNLEEAAWETTTTQTEQHTEITKSVMCSLQTSHVRRKVCFYIFQYNDCNLKELDDLIRYSKNKVTLSSPIQHGMKRHLQNFEFLYHKNA